MIKHGDSFELIKDLDDKSIQVVITSPPYGDIIDCKDYKGIKPDKYVDWILPLIKEIGRVLKDDGSFILNIDSKVVNGFRHTYCHELVYRIVKETELKLFDEYTWCKKNSIPLGGDRLHHRSEHLFHFVKNKPRLYPENIMVDKKVNSIERQKSKMPNTNRIETGLREKGHFIVKDINPLTKPSNLLYFNVASSVKHDIKHPAPFHPDLPIFFINYCSKEGDTILDTFSGRGTTHDAAESMNRIGLGFELNEKYIK